MWFTFKFVSLNHWKQPHDKKLKVKRSCDLLSNLYLWTIGNNLSPICNPGYRVVIYFQICIFEPLETTARTITEFVSMLWFTFKFVSLNHWKQLSLWGAYALAGCDLLSNLYLWTIGNNLLGMWKLQNIVVIYFQICIFEPLETTEKRNATTWKKLWFTFKFVSLNHWKQHVVMLPSYPSCCDLLSNLYLWTIGNNFSE